MSNRERFIDFMRRGFEQGDDTVVDELTAPDLVEHQFGLDGSGAAAREKVKAAIREVHRMVPDMRYSFDAMTEDGDTLWVRMTGRGTHQGGLFGGAPTGNPVEVTVIDICRFDAEGRIAEHWGVPDRFALLAQTGTLARLVA
ncbi:ester cyclase [Nocardia thailandica]|uniref:Ester cyclase n=1 Tax=Nocardia thailandica TaxID=257275 RepID=A0ABW6PXA1_9NOCA